MTANAHRHVARRIAVALAFFAAALGPPAAFADPSSYNDAGMHFDAPADFETLPVPPGDPTGSEDSSDPVPVAAFVYHRGKDGQRAITITVANFDGGVKEFDVSHVSDMRKGDSVFVVKNESTKLANGMPAYFVSSTSGNTAGQYGQRFEYLVCDGTRSIDVAYSGRQGDFDEAAARAALATLYVVVYPKHRP